MADSLKRGLMKIYHPFIRFAQQSAHSILLIFGLGE
jgi:hypothetical protein